MAAPIPLALLLIFRPFLSTVSGPATSCEENEA